MSTLFFKNLGKLFYAIAAADKNIDDMEILALKEVIESDWKAMDLANHDDLKLITATFNNLKNEDNQNIDKLFSDFINFKNEEHHLFTKSINRLILHTCNAIASSFSSRNKSELILLAKLEIELKK
ncbi:hypothetical protein [Oceanihabitans sediminis]|uniref:TerB family tellurite resistance protein n=1 Tax=Oceanihabitans sediminis TaxID=1812012 RepID=A0A368P4W6_9FLAO|nr:hypothetical protein [Oceanihabitans sediminis]MDX1278498.1 hypothetical protein [Oceanihabitans sediminis]MDX1772532.1 hypothetical protein [Oceanihabitans sediminis]RBP34181.1 hypothetical protein DFR65_10164 [Oceanihabitans sediminis]RCU57872.1 hypothetical protein DU428_00315 [Oceanihabitans sediminis]